MEILENVSIAKLTTMRIGGRARYVVYVNKPEEVPKAYLFAQVKRLPVYILGRGANTIGHDEGFPGVIIISKITGVEVEQQPDGTTLLHCNSGEIWDDVVAKACELGLTGIEAMSAIPGSVGAAPVQNIGAYGQDVASVLTEVEAYDTKAQKFITLYHEDLNFAYRQSIFNGKNKQRYFITRITLQLRQGQLQPPFYNSLQAYLDERQITDYSPAQIRKAVVAVRATKIVSPKVEPSSGSFFKNIYLPTEADALMAEQKNIPVFNGKISSGWLIEHAGLKGKIMHGMKVSNKSALILVNDSATGYADLAAARTEITDTVKKKFGYELEQEPEEIPFEPEMPEARI